MGRRSTEAGCLSGTTLLVLATVVVLVLLFLPRIRSPLDMLRRPEPQTERLGPALIKQIKAVNRLETQSLVLDGVYRVGQDAGAGNLLYRDVVVLAARAEVVAGIDLQKLSEQDVRVVDKTVAITLPASELLVFSMDEQATRVFDRERGWLVGLGLVSSDPNLETRARRYAEQKLLEDACAKGIMQQAAEEGRQAMERLLRALEYTQVTVVATAGSCAPAGASSANGATATAAQPTTAVAPTTTPALPTATIAPPTVPPPPATATPTPASGGLSGTVVVVETPTP